MTTVITGMSMSLDGFVAGPNISHSHPLGEGGERLHDWLFNRNPRQGGVTSASHQPANERNAAVAREMHATTGAVIVGRRTFDVGIDHWEDVPYPVPTFVLTHEVRPSLAMPNGTFTFVNDSIEAALHQANEAAGARKVMLMGAAVVQQFLKAGFVDEIQIALVPVLFGRGCRLFEFFGEARIELDIAQVIETPDVAHITYRVLKAVAK